MKKHKSKKIRVRTIVSLVLIVLFLPVVLFSIFRPAGSEAAWFNDSWGYRQRFSFTHNASLSERRVTVTVNTSTLVTAGKMQSDCDDARFTDINGLVLRYQLVSGCNTASTSFDVLFPSIVNGANDAYIYYGNTTSLSRSEDISSYTSLSPSGGAASLSSEEKGTSASVYYKFDELADNRCTGGTNDVCDSIGSSVDGAISGGATWRGSHLCVSGGCLQFDGSDDVVTVSQNSRINLSDQLAAAFTYSTWIRPMGAGEGSAGQVFQKGANNFLRVGNLSSGVMDLVASVDLGTSDATLTVTGAIPNNQWSYVSVSYTDDADDEISIWVNGKLLGSSTNGSGSPVTDTNSLLIGGTTTNNFQGYIDEFKLFPLERSAAQQRVDYQNTSSADGGAAQVGTSNNNLSLSSGLVGYWTMDEGSWTNNCSTGSVLDLSGNANHGRACPNTTGPTGGANGKFGHAGSFDNTDDYIDIPTPSINPTNSFTISSWIYPTSAANSNPIVGISTGNDFNFTLETSGALSVYDGATSVATATNLVPQNTWTHVMVSFDQTTRIPRYFVNGTEVTSSSTTLNFAGSLTNFHIARYSTSYFSGRIDETRIYNRALSPAEAKLISSWNPDPVGYWRLDENTGTSSVYDQSGNVNTLSMVGTMTTDDWINGKYGSALDLDGTDDQLSTGLFDFDSLDMGTSNFTISMWLVRDTATTVDGIIHKRSTGYGTTCTIASDTGYQFIIYDTDELSVSICDGTNGWEMYANNPIATGTWYHVSAVVDRSNLSNSRLYLNGIQITDTKINDGSNPPITGNVSNTNPFEIGNSGGGGGLDNTDPYDGKVDDIRIYNYARTKQQVIEDMNAGHPAGGSPIGSQTIYWQFDDMRSTTANNKVSGGTNGTLTSIASPATATSGWTGSGRANSAITFDGSDDKVIIATASDSEVDYNGSEQFTACAWIYPTTMAGSSEFDAIITKWDTTSTTRGYRLTLTNDDADTTGNIRAEIYDESADQTISVSSTNDSISVNTWSHTCMLFNGGTAGLAGDLTLFVNGRNVGSNAANASFLGLEDVSADFTVGDYDATDAAAANTGFTGIIDEVQVYSGLLTTEQVLLVQNGNAALNVATTSNTEASQVVDGAGAAPVGYWNFDDAIGSTTLLDRSGQDNDGTIRSQMRFTSGKYGGGMYFNGSANNTATTGVFLEDNTYDALTQGSVSFWFKPDDLAAGDDFQTMFGVAEQGAIANNLLAISFFENTNEIEYYIGDASGGCNITATFSVTNTTSWNHFAATTNSSGNALYLNGIRQTPSYSAGSSSSTCFFDDVSENTTNYTLGCYSNGAGSCTATALYEGVLDEVKVFNYSLTRSQVAHEYNRGKPVAHWKLDECQGATAYDSSGNGLNGTINPGASGNTAVGTCNSGTSTHMWNDGNIGKFNSSLGFDGTDDNVTIPDNSLFDFTTNMTASAWVYMPSIVDSEQHIVSNNNNGANTGYALMYRDNATGFVFRVYSSGGANNVACTRSYQANTWYHVAGTYDGANQRIYVNGVLCNTAANTNSIPASSESMRIGFDSTLSLFYFSGQIDDVRLYNYPLSATQIRLLFNDASSVRFGPTVGQP
jgi:Concanavalin A-like lectin/glucanases superfamily/Domain of unknown function (DUF2341)